MQTHFTLLAGARAALLVQHFGKEEDKAWIVPPGGPLFHKTFSEALKERPYAPLRVVLDCKNLDLKQEALPPVDLVRRQKAMRQQASHLFPKSLLRGVGAWREGSGFYALHAACTADPVTDALLQQVHEASTTVESLSFLAAEWPDYAKQLKTMPSRPWSIVLVLSEAMGLRQIVLKDGRPIFTRLHEELAPSQGVAALGAAVAKQLRSTRDYLPRLEPGALREAPAQLFVPSCLEGLGENEELRQLSCHVVPLKTPHAALLPPEWEADMVLATQAAEQKLPFVPLVPFWMKERMGRNRLRQFIAMLLMGFGFAGIYMGSSIMFAPKPAPLPEMIPPPPVAAPVAEAPKPPVLKLEALIYNSAEDWSVWISGKKFTAAQPAVDNLRVTGISADGVSVHWEEGGAEKDFTLRQENAASGKVQ